MHGIRPPLGFRQQQNAREDERLIDRVVHTVPHGNDNASA